MTGILHQGECIAFMRTLPPGSADFALTDPPYLVRYQDRNGRSLANDDNDAWLDPACEQMHRVLARDALMVSFYGYQSVDRFMAAWRAAGFRPVGHVVFRKPYASSSGFLARRHENAYVLAKGRPSLLARRDHSGNFVR